MEIQQIFEELHKVRICKSGYEFSTKFLGKSKSYYSVIKAKNELASISALAMLEASLQQYADLYNNDKFETFGIRRKQLLELSKKATELRSKQCALKLSQIKVI